MKRWMCAAALIMAVAVVVGCAPAKEKTLTASENVLAVTPVKIFSRVGGNAPLIKEPSVLLINDAAALKGLGVPELDNLGVDFATKSLAIVALGECRTTGYWAHVTGVQKLGKNVYIQGVANKPGDKQVVEQTVTYPFEAAVVEKVTGNVLPEIKSVVAEDHPSDE